MTESQSPPFREIAEYTYDWESWVTPDGRTRWVNAAVERMTGYSVAECLAMPDYPLPIVVPEDRSRVEAAHAAAADGVPGNDLEFRIRHKDGHTRWGAMSWQSLIGPQGRRLGFRTSVRDIDDRKGFEERLRAAKRRAEAAVRAKTTFLAGVGHELRTPIHTILGHAELLLLAPADDAARKQLGIIVQQAGVLGALVDDLLDLSGAELGRVHIDRQPTALAELVDTMVEVVRPTIRADVELRLRVSSAVPSHVCTDGRRLSQILRNLLDNAARATRRGSILVELDAVDDERVRIAIEDTGPGIDLSQLERLRAPFERGPDPSTHGRMGLGLPITYQLAEALDVELRVHAEPGSGTRFELLIPVVEAALAPSGTEAFDLDVLVVDDTPASRDVIEAALVGFGCRVTTAEDGLAAVRACASGAYDLVLMDRHMPTQDGIAAAHLIRAQLTRKRPRIVILTADPSTRLSIVEGDVDAFVSKPLSRRALVDVLRWAVSSGPRPTDATQVVPGLDRAVVNDLKATRTADGGSMFDRVTARVIEDNHRLLDELETAIVRKLADAAGRIAHRIAGNCLLVGDRETAKAANALEEHLDRHEYGEAQVEFDTLVAACERLAELLRHATRGQAMLPE